jgi:RHS repeat-associated protein
MKIFRGQDEIETVKKVGALFLVLALNATPLTAFASFGGGTPTIPNPTVFSLQKVTPKVDGQTGAFTLHIPIDIPPGRNGLQPDLALDYNSQNNRDGIAGYGWSLSIPYIQRLNKTGSQNLYGTNPYYTSSIDGELATTSSATPNLYRARVDDGSFHSYTYASSTNSWTVYDKSGTRYLYGSTTQAQMSSASSISQVYRWMLEEIRDTNNNYVKFVYVKDGNQIYPSQIIYTGNGVTDGPATITFATSTRPDPYIDYRPTFKVTTNWRISEIDASFNGSVVRKYLLSYGSGNNGVRSMLTSVQEEGYDDSSNLTTLPAMTFNYVSTSTQFYTPGSSTLYAKGQSYVVADTKGDGINAVNEFYYNNSTNATGSQMLIDQNTLVTNVVPPDWWALAPNPPTPQERGVRYIDVNADGKADVARGYWDDIAGTSTRKLYVNSSTSTGYAWTLATTTFNTGNGTFANPNAYWKLDETSGAAADSATANNTLTNNNSLTYVAGKINNGANFVAASSTYLSITNATQVGLDPTSTFSCAGWVKFTTLPGAGENILCAKYSNNTDGSYSVELGAEPNGIYVLYTDNGNTSQNAHLLEFDSPANLFSATSTWYHVAVAVDAGNKVVTAWINGATTTMTARGGESASSINQGAAKFSIGGMDSETNGITRKLDGMLDEVGFWKGYLLTQSDVTTLYNGGAGISYPFATSTSQLNGIVPLFEWHGAGANGTITTGLFGDVNGDGLPDYVLSLDSHLDGLPPNGTYLGNGSAWDAATSTIFVSSKQLPATNPTITNPMLIDINGDGLDDLVYSDASGTHVLLNTGTGWESSPDPHWDIATSTLFEVGTSTTFYERGIRFMDMNGDGLPDFVRSYNVPVSGGCSSEIATVNQVMLNTGSGWATTSAYTLPSYIVSGDSSSNPCAYNGEYGNWIGNGQMDQDVMSTVTYPKGGSTSISYSPTTQLGTNPQLPYSLLAVTKQVNHNGNGSNEETDYSYAGGLQYLPTNVRDRKFAGFASSTVTRPDSVTSTYYDQGTLVQTSLGEQSDGYAQINHPFRVDVLTPGSVAVTKTFNRWDTTAHGNSTFVGLGRQVVQTYAADGTHRDSAVDYKYSSTTDDLLETDNYGEVTGNSDGTFTDVTGDSRTTYITYAASSSVNISVPIEKKIVDNSSATSTDSKLYYDNLAFGSVNVGNQTEQDNWITGSSYATSTKTYNGYGLVTQSTDPRGKVSTYSYDSFNLYPATTTNPLSQSTTYTYNYANGKVKLSKDPNGRISSSTYDGVGRLSEIDQSDVVTPSTVVPKATFQYIDSATATSSVHESDYLNSATTTDTYDFYDGLSRLIQERKSSENTGTSTVTDSIYNSAGLLASQSFPYFSAGTSTTAATTTSTLFTNYTYDPLGRTATIVNAVGTTTKTYARWTMTVTDALSHTKDYISDAYGNLAQVVEYASPTATTTYTYDAANDLTKITDASGNIRDFTYDGLGRKLTAEDLHAVGHSSFGTSTYVYDNAGNLTSQTDPKNQVTTKTYDDINRLLTETFNSQAQVTNTYDSCTNGKGYLCTASSTSALTKNAYDVLGRVSVSTSTIKGTDYATTYGYDRQGNITNLTYPNGIQVANTYNTAGLLESVAQKAVGASSFTNLITNFDYGPTGQVTLKNFASGASTTYAYDPTALYRLTRITSYGTTTVSAGVSSIPNQTADWKLDESSGPASDATNNGNALTNNNSLTYSSGKVNNGANFVAASSTYLSITNAAQVGLDPTSTFSCAGWVKFTTLPGSSENILCAKYSNLTDGSYSVELGAEPNGLYVLYTDNGNTGLNAHLQEFDSAANLFTATSTWYHVAVAVDAANKVVTAWVNGATTTMTARGGDGPITSINQGAAPFTLGMLNSETGSGITRKLDGMLDEVGFWKGHLLTQADVNLLYNSGNGAQYPFNAASTTAPSIFQNLNYTYDSVGNITSITDGGTSTAHTVNYTYDALNRLLTASTTAASSTSYRYTYTYDPLGNITANSTGSGSSNTYVYGATGYANADAVTSIGNGTATSTLTYDNNGNLTAYGASSTYAYDYWNRMTQAVVNNSTSTYGYDTGWSRVFQTVGNSTTIYPNNFYSVINTTNGATTTATTTAYIYGGDTLLASIDSQLINGTATGTPTTHYIHPDILGSTNYVSDANMNVLAANDYFPYGALRINSGTYVSQRQYVGQFTDSQTSLSYLNSRYFDSTRGQFLSQEPIFLNIGDPGRVSQLAQLDQQTYLGDPQQLNAYSYGRDNPIARKDPNGRFAQVLAGAVIGDVMGVGSQLYSDLSTGQTSGVSTYVAAGLGGAANGAVIASGGYWYGPVGGFVGGGVQSSISQFGSIMNGSRDTFSFSDVGGNGLAQAPYGFIPGLRVKGVTVGRNSFEAVTKSVLTSYDNGYINRIGIPTAAKMFAGGVLQNGPSTAAQAFLSVPSNTQSLIASLTSLVSALQSLVQFLSKR